MVTPSTNSRGPAGAARIRLVLVAFACMAIFFALFMAAFRLGASRPERKVRRPVILTSYFG